MGSGSRNSLSRRGFVEKGIAASLLLGTSRSFAADKPSLGTPAKTGGEPVSTDIDSQQHLDIEVLINSQGPFRFVVDTGADRSVIAEDVAGSLGLTTGTGVLVEGIIRTIPALTVPVRTLSFGAIEKRNLELPILPRVLLTADGYLGLDAIGEHSVTFDFDRRYLTVEDSRAIIPVSDEQAVIDYKGSTTQSTVRAVGGYGHLKSFQCEVDGVPAAAFLDSGAQVTLGNSRLAAALTEKNSHLIEMGTVPITGVTGGEVQGRVVSVDRIRLADVSFRAKAMVIADLGIFETWSLADQPALLIGMNYLSRFSQVTIDYALKQFRFDLTWLDPTLRAVSRGRRSGIESG